MTRNRKAIVLWAGLAAALLLPSPSLAYYHYVHFLGSRNGPFTPIYEKFNVASLNNSTLGFLVSDQSPSVYAPNDTFGSILSQVRQAVAQWNAAPNSDLRLAFGGLENQNQNSNTPGVDVVFIDLPPGLLGQSAPTTSTVVTTASNGERFFPILKSTVMLSRDTNQGAGPSYLDAFFTTAVHEIGHALGLQHTWTGSAMSQGVIRNTSRTRPLDADDYASLSVLYGSGNWQSGFGSISGRVAFTNGAGVSLASVVAISPTGSSVSSLTNPDGTYSIQGVPPGNYLVYAHPLPPGSIANDNSGLRPPVDGNLVQFPASGLFGTVFAPGTLDPLQATVFRIDAGRSATVNLSVQARPSIPAYDLITYSKIISGTRTYAWNGDTTITPAFINYTQSPNLVIVQANSGVMPNPQSMTILGGFAPAILNAASVPTIVPYQAGVVAAYFNVGIGTGVGPRHLVFNFGNDIYVLPNGINVVQQGPPVINSVTPNPDGTATVTGAGFNSLSAVYFDGLKAVTQTPFNGTDIAGSMTVIPPPGSSGQVAIVSVYNIDGQSSMILQSQNPQTYTYPVTPSPQITSVSLSALPAGSTAAIDITASNARFDDNYITVGFGSDDVTVRRVWVLSAQNPAHLVANVTVAPGAAITSSDISIISGFQVIPQNFGFQTQPPRPNLPLISSVANTDPNQQTIYPGSAVTISGSNLTPPGGVQLTLNGQPMQAQIGGAVPPGQIGFTVPANFPVGPASLALSNGAGVAFAVEVQIDNLPPSITQVSNLAGTPLTNPGVTVGAGDLINVAVSGLDSSVIGTQNLQVTVSGVPMVISQVSPSNGGQYQLQVYLTQSFNGSQVPLAVWVNGSSSQPVTITVR